MNLFSRKVMQEKPLNLLELFQLYVGPNKYRRKVSENKMLPVNVFRTFVVIMLTIRNKKMFNMMKMLPQKILLEVLFGFQNLCILIRNNNNIPSNGIQKCSLVNDFER